MRLYIVYNNDAEQGFSSGWGFSAMIETEKNRILFDTGDKPDGLLNNLKKLKIEPEDIDIVVISHEHWDHTGGLDGFMKQNKGKAKLIMPKDVKDVTEIADNVFSTGALQSEEQPEEQSLFIKTPNGLVVIVGCSHPGVTRILDIAGKHGKVHAIFGGFHGFSDYDNLEGIDIIGACHCTQHMEEIRKRYKDNFREILAGQVMEL
jgi:7,8-dihydropterin-6-yl-methyl-4-(beta-D-ribofuranosyl)aminobenzene 5'-phosphate synthase